MEGFEAVFRRCICPQNSQAFEGPMILRYDFWIVLVEMLMFLWDFGLFGNSISRSILLQQANNSRTWVEFGKESLISRRVQNHGLYENFCTNFPPSNPMQRFLKLSASTWISLIDAFGMVNIRRAQLVHLGKFF